MYDSTGIQGCFRLTYSIRFFKFNRRGVRYILLKFRNLIFGVFFKLNNNNIFPLVNIIAIHIFCLIIISIYMCNNVIKLLLRICALLNNNIGGIECC